MICCYIMICCYELGGLYTGTDKRQVRRDKKGRFKESADVSRSLSADARHDAKHEAKLGQGDKGDRNPRRPTLHVGSGDLPLKSSCAISFVPEG